MKISIVVPVYKAARYLDTCLQSILKQTYGDFELILVDDGSPDNSGMICDQWAQRDGRIVVIHKENGGVSSARNAGLDAAQGQYVLFVDSDDYLQPDYIDRLRSTKADLTICGLEVRTQTGERIYTIIHPERHFSSKKEIDFADAYQKCILYSPYCKLFRRDIIEDKHIRFPQDISWGEDGMFVADYLAEVETLSVIEYAGYCYIKYSGEGTLSTRVRQDIMDMVSRSREYCIEKVRQTAPWAYDETKKVCVEDIRRNCADFVSMLLRSKEVRKVNKRKMLERFIQNKYVKETFACPREYYSEGIAQCIKKLEPKQILRSYRRWAAQIKRRDKLFMAYGNMPKSLKKCYQLVKRLVKHDP